MIKISQWSYNIYISQKLDWNIRETNPYWFHFPKNQPHLWGIMVADKLQDFDNYDGDGFITSIEKVKIWVCLADCNWIVLMWRKYFWVLHAWWRGLKAWIIQNWLNCLLDLWEEKQNINVYIWPSIRVCCYVVNDDFVANFDAKYFVFKNWETYFDMILLIKDIFKEYWIKNVEINKNCTHCGDEFFSYRNGNIVERIIVWIEKI